MFPYYLNDPREFVDDYCTIVPNNGPAFDDLFAAATESFPLNDAKPDNQTLSVSAALSPFPSSSGSSLSAGSPSLHEEEAATDSDPDSDVEELSLEYPTELSADLLRAQSIAAEDSVLSLPSTLHNPLLALENCSVQQPSQKRNVKSRRSVSRSPSAVPPTSSRRPTKDQSHSSLFSAPDPDYDPVSESDGDATDDEYVPSPPLNPLKRRRNSSVSSKHQSHTSTSPRASPAAYERRPTKKPRVPPPSRNEQASSMEAIRAALASPNPDFICPFCGWKQMNQRVPDYKRHVRTHIRAVDNDKSQGWWCKGVRLDDDLARNLPPSAEMYLFLDEWRAGGCQRSFARRDALKRHLDNPNCYDSYDVIRSLPPNSVFFLSCSSKPVAIASSHFSRHPFDREHMFPFL
ncbi:hypothetical protein Hypma_000776 [Hypsizygus marmoreus]|uniref:C2H2-type domain-containing protein n=1 Tax=Hypsizygus marmoreus TaxID=39966 RepID=A0A369JG95_HYPMA|nr:hypothetical protein Hypma_000776 [Hypsizygus marmoreus]